VRRGPPTTHETRPWPGFAVEAKTILASEQNLLELGFEVRPLAAHIPDVGAIGVIDAALAQPSKRRIPHGAGQSSPMPSLERGLKSIGEKRNETLPQ
jgi:hypothetical protein